ncbi:hypothetical protein [Pseudomonas fluorescens]|uniref:hypothetical protein n=1 Tax=Pseudomonas fluorescens TaxID=294 RepID=UPI00123FE1B6|nr:hypothetical protein [Pseudomonas fluorescens]VVO94800.1 hypothetical protein PS898_02504 [Pseudomonas fluorescens]
MSEDLNATNAAGDEDRKAAYQEAAVELAKGIALGAVPFLGQAIDAYDTVESSIDLYNAGTAEGKEDAKFDLLMAVIGWIPGPGDGLKKSLRIVNRDPQRFAPVLFDLLRFVLDECGVKTSPEELLKQIFDASKLRAELDDIISGVKGSSTYKSLPAWTQSTIVTVLATARDNMPEMIGIVEKRLLKWKGMQRNSSAMASGSSKSAKGHKPAGKDPSVATQGKSGASETRPNSIDKNKTEKKSYHISNEGLGVSGEHIADYICAVEFGWGKDWDGHDKGADGKWLEGKPSASKLGKLSKGGSPKSHNILYKLSDPANGTGIDAVWRADPATNAGRKFAIVEAKASKNEDAPKFLRRPNNTRKPSINSKLGVSGEPQLSDLLEPIEEVKDGNGSTGKATGKNRTKVSGKKSSDNASVKAAKPSKARKNDLMIQMSKEWISKNLRDAVGVTMTREILNSYSRHLFFSPLYHLSGSPEEHAVALLSGSPESSHAKHAAFHYGEDEVKQAVNRRKKSLAKKHGALDSLRLEV